MSLGMLPVGPVEVHLALARRCLPVNHVVINTSYVTGVISSGYSVRMFGTAPKKKKNTVAGVRYMEDPDTLPKMKNDGAVPCRRHSVSRSRFGSSAADDVSISDGMLYTHISRHRYSFYLHLHRLGLG